MKPKNKAAPEKNTIPTSHDLFGSMMKETLIPVNLEVESNYEIGKAPPRLDVLIIRRTGPRWSKAQLEFLPDGIRQSRCKHIILELKYTESVSKLAIYQTLGYLSSYVQLKALKVENVSTFLVSSKKPQEAVLENLGLIPTDIQGVYQPEDNRIMPIQLISLNELSNDPYNLWIKLFASKYTERAFVLSQIVRHNRKKLKRGLGVVFLKIVKFWNILGETTMKRLQKIVYGPEDLTDEDIATFFSLFNIKPEMAINYFKPEKVVTYLNPKERLHGLKPKDVMTQFEPKDVMTQFEPKDRLHGLKPKDVVTQFEPEDLLNGLDPETIEAYLNKIKKQ
jgi:hypothetical protein